MPPSHPSQVYAAHALDRAAHRRRDVEWLARARNDPATRVIFFSELLIPASGPEDTPLLHAPTLAELGEALPSDSIFLGERDGVAWFASEAGEAVQVAGRMVELRSDLAVLPADEAAMAAYARALLHWHRGHRFCGYCGARHRAYPGRPRAAAARPAGARTFPRTDPAVIVLVTHGDQCLLGRSPRFPPGMYSTLAGFVEPGKSLEQTLRREVFEEVGRDPGRDRLPRLAALAVPAVADAGISRHGQRRPS